MKRSPANAEHYKWGSNCDGWHLLKTDGLSVIEEVMPAGTSEKLHYHQHSQQLFYILSGSAVFEINGEVFEVSANESIHVPVEARHFIANKTLQDLRFLVISEPKAHGDRTEI